MTTIRPVAASDSPSWLHMRRALWPDDTGDTHAREIERYFAGQLRMPLEVLMAFDANGRAVGFAELSIRTYAEDCATERVAYLEGWYVEPDARRKGFGGALVRAAEDWGRRHGCTEFGSDAVYDNAVSAVAHRALGFKDTVQLRCFKKMLSAVAIVASFAVVTPVLCAPLAGTWSNVEVSKSEDPHASGIEVEIRQRGGEPVGFMSEYVGPVADPPVGKLEGIRYDEKTGAISFTSKLSVGVVAAARGNDWLPSKNLYEFKGTVGKTGITGVLRRKFVDEEGKETAYEESVTLTHKTVVAGDATAGESPEQWLARWNDALKKRGPKW